MEEAKEAVLGTLKKVVFKLIKRVLIVLFLLVLPIILLAASLYFMVVHVEAAEVEGDWSSTPFAAGQYISGVSVGEDGNLKSTITAQELWDKMIENGSRVNEYLEGPEDLVRLMKAEIVTQYPDTRPADKINDPIDWEAVLEGSDSLQGIIKFDRANSDGTTSTMTYVEPQILEGWIEEYNTTGNETAKRQALSHFTLRQNTSTSSDNTNVTTSGKMADVSEAIVKEATKLNTYGLSGSVCQTWVGTVYQKAGFGYVPSGCCAYLAGTKWGTSSDFSQIVNGAAVWTGAGSYRGTKSCSHASQGGCGHAGIYYKDEQGNDWVFSFYGGSVHKDTLQHFLEYYGQGNTPVWGWQGGISVEMEKDGEGNANVTTSTEKSNSKSSSYCAVVATWEQIDTTLTTNDPDIKARSETQYTMTTTNINYEEMVEKYTMPFDLLWAFLVIGEDKDFIFELTDLIYNSDIRVTIYDNLTVNTDIDEWNYTKRTKAIVDADITANCNGQSATDSIKNDKHDPHKEESYTTTKKVVTQTNTVKIALTRANVWIVDYQNEYSYNRPKQENSNTYTVEEEDEEYQNSPDSTGNSYSCEHINTMKQELKRKVKQLAKNNAQSTISGTTGGTGSKDSPEATQEQLDVTFDENIKVEYYNKYVNISDNVTNKVKAQDYTQGKPEVREKTDKDSKEPNFVTIFNKYEYRFNKSRIKDAASWLFEIIENNEDTSDMLDLVKYLLYKATNTNFGVKKYDFSEFDASLFSSVTSIYGNSIQEKVWFALKAIGYSDVSVAAAMGNIHYESGTFDPKKVEGGFNENNGGIGICQWTNQGRGSQGRNTNLKKYAKSKGKPWQDEDIQVEFLVAELSKNNKTEASKYAGFAFLNSTYTGTAYQYKEWTDAKDTDPLDEKKLKRLTEVFCFTFERPSASAGRASMSTRQKYALQYYNQFHGKEAPSVSGPSTAVANGTAQQKLKFLFPDGTPTTDSQAKQYMSTVNVAMTTKNGTKTTGKLTIHKSLVNDVQEVFKVAQDNKFRIYEAAGYYFRSMNNGGSGKLSHHSYGVAIDINVKENYSHKGKTIYAGSFWNPKKSQYSIPKDGVLVKAFEAKGWKWGGNWSGDYQDYMHFSFTGN